MINLTKEQNLNEGSDEEPLGVWGTWKDLWAVTWMSKTDELIVNNCNKVILSAVRSYSKKQDPVDWVMVGLFRTEAEAILYVGVLHNIRKKELSKE